VHSAPRRFAIGAAFLALVVVGAALAGLEPIAIAALVAVALVLAALVGRAYAREAGRAGVGSPTAVEAPSEELPQPDHVQAVDPEPAPEPELAPEPPREPELAVSERSARAILASGPPPVQEPPPRKPEPMPETAPKLVTEPETEPVSNGPPREWNLWELHRLVRERPDDERHDEWTAMLVSLREFARADGTLPLEFDELVRDSFGALLEPARTEAVAAP
jgi:hypothetical protein